jgi:hypothetical protein
MTNGQFIQRGNINPLFARILAESGQTEENGKMNSAAKECDEEQGSKVGQGQQRRNEARSFLNETVKMTGRAVFSSLDGGT